MYTTAAIRDIHERSHRSLSGLLAHCRAFGPDELGRAFEGFGHPTMREQFHHVIAAEAYWMGVLAGRANYDSDDVAYTTVAALEAFRAEVSAATSTYLRDTSDEEINRSRPCMTWGDVEVELTPALVVLRTQTHAFQHMGQITAMCRLLGRPVPAGLDFPLR